MEVLEDRVLLAGTSGSQLVQIEQVAALLDGRISGATIITHGFQMGPDSIDLTEADGDSLLPMAEEIWKRANTTTSTSDPDAFLVDYDIPDEGASAGIDLAQSKLPASGSKKTNKGELVFCSTGRLNPMRLRLAGLRRRVMPSLRRSSDWALWIRRISRPMCHCISLATALALR